jgi:hypothetical protein
MHFLSPNSNHIVRLYCCLTQTTDLKTDNLFLEVPNIENVISTDLANFPIPSHAETYFPVAVSQPLTLDIGALDTKSIVVKIGDLGGG